MPGVSISPKSELTAAKRSSTPLGVTTDDNYAALVDKVFNSIQTPIGQQARLATDLATISDESISMLSGHITSFLKLISSQIEETSQGINSIHHFHNVQCGIANILSLLEYNNEVVDKADQLSRRASSYITGHDLTSSKAGDEHINEDADRLRAAHEALAGFHFAVQNSQPNSRVRTLGLA